MSSEDKSKIDVEQPAEPAADAEEEVGSTSPVIPEIQAQYPAVS
ncbi:hypothetical protein [Streptomyces olivochromogenes]|nr:hypothetical protein [Streptomyces olivochromogenes]